MACPVYSSDGRVSDFWLESELGQDGQEWIVLRWGKRGGRRLFAKSDVGGQIYRRTVTIGECRLSFDPARQQVQIDYEPTTGPDHGLRLWLLPTDFEKLLAGNKTADES